MDSCGGPAGPSALRPTVCRQNEDTVWQSNVKHGSGKSTHGSVEWDMVDFPAMLATFDYQTAWLEPRTALSWRHQGFYPTTSTKVSECLKALKATSCPIMISSMIYIYNNK